MHPSPIIRRSQKQSRITFPFSTAALQPAILILSHFFHFTFYFFVSLKNFHFLQITSVSCQLQLYFDKHRRIMANFGAFMAKKMTTPGDKMTRSVLAAMAPRSSTNTTVRGEREDNSRIISTKIGFLSQPAASSSSSDTSSSSSESEDDSAIDDNVATTKDSDTLTTAPVPSEAQIERPLAMEASSGPPSKKRKRTRGQRQVNPRARSKPRLHQNFRECYLNTKKKVSQLQPNHGTTQNFFYAIENNIQDPKVRGASKTAGKIMVYGQGPLFEQYLASGIKRDKKTHYVFANDYDFAEHQFSDAD